MPIPYDDPVLNFIGKFLIAFFVGGGLYYLLLTIANKFDNASYSMGRFARFMAEAFGWIALVDSVLLWSYIFYYVYK